MECPSDEEEGFGVVEELSDVDNEESCTPDEVQSFNLVVDYDEVDSSGYLWHRSFLSSLLLSGLPGGQIRSSFQQDFAMNISFDVSQSLMLDTDAYTKKLEEVTGVATSSGQNSKHEAFRNAACKYILRTCAQSQMTIDLSPTNDTLFAADKIFHLNRKNEEYYHVDIVRLPQTLRSHPISGHQEEKGEEQEVEEEEGNNGTCKTRRVSFAASPPTVLGSQRLVTSFSSSNAASLLGLFWAFYFIHISGPIDTVDDDDSELIVFEEPGMIKQECWLYSSFDF